MNQLFLCELPGYTAEGNSPQKPGLTLEQLRKAFHSWLTEEYMQRQNADTGQTPLLRWSQKIHIPRMLDSLERLNMLLMSIPEDRLVRKDGVHILTYCYFNTELQNGYMRESVQVRYDPSDVSKVYIFHQNKFICTAECDELSGTKPTFQDIQKTRASRVKLLRSVISTAAGLVKSYSKDSSRFTTDELPNIQIASDADKRIVQEIRRYSVDE